MSYCIFVFDIDGVLLDEEEAFLGSIRKRGLKNKGIELLEDRAKKGRVFVLTGRRNAERMKVLLELSEKGLDTKLVSRFIFRNEEIEVREWKLKILGEIAERWKICEIHEDDEELLWNLKKDPRFKGISLFLYREMSPEPF
ncbi:MAG: hypothetical protein ACP5HH_04190 [Fervidicoccaceae archaeon]